MSVEALFLAVIEPYDKGESAVRIIRVANRAYTTKRTDATPDIPFLQCLQQPADVERSLFAKGATRGSSSVTLGSLVLLNDSGGTLDFMSQLAYDTRTVTVYRSTKANPSFPADFSSYVATMEQPEWDNATITIRLRDKFYQVAAAPLQTNRYAGDNLLPDGLEGTAADLKGKPKPVCLGTVKSVPAPCVNTSKLIYQVYDGAVESIDAVYDRGVALIPGQEWNLLPSTVGSDFGLLYYGGGLYVRTGRTGEIYTSTDGEHWTLVYTLGGTTPRIFAAAYSANAGLAPSEWLISAQIDTGVPVLLHTTDDFASVSTSTPPTSFALGVIAFSYVFYHEAARRWVIGVGNEIYSAPDAYNYTLAYEAPGGVLAPVYYGGAYGDGMAVAVGLDPGNDNQGTVISSPDGITWTPRGTGLTTGSTTALLRVIRAYGQFVAIGSATDTVVSSADGITFTRGMLPERLPDVAQIAAANGLFIVPGSHVNTLQVSVDGINWGTYQRSGLSFIPGALASNGSQLVAGGNANVVGYTTPVVYASTSDMMSDASTPLPGEFIPCPSAGYFRLGSTPDGIITTDVTQSSSNDAASLANVVLARAPGGFSFLAADVTALQAETMAPLGHWTMDEGVTCDQVLDLITNTIGGSWYLDKLGRFRIARFDEPTGDPAITFTAGMIVRDSLKRVASNDQNNGIPIYQVVVQWGRIFQTITTDVADVVSDAARAVFAQEYRNAIATDADVLTIYPSAGVLTIPSLYVYESDAQAEADRQLELRGVQRDYYQMQAEFNDESDAVDLNALVGVLHPRYGLTLRANAQDDGAAGLFRLVDVQPDAKNKRVTLGLWGSPPRKNLISAIDFAQIISDIDGAYIISEKSA